MLRANNLSDVASVSASRNNLGLAAVAASGSYSDLTGLPKPRAQRLVTASPIVVNVATDEVINCNIATGTPSCTLPAAASRAGRVLTFKDVGAQFGAHNLTILPNGTERIDGAPSLALSVNRQVVHLMPFNDGVSTGWAIV
jgi:hypothetical protein